MTKKELRNKYNFSQKTLANLLNNRYYEQLKEEGYVKNDNYISPKVLKKFYSLYGEPFNTKEDDF
jgi:transcriptional regulator with XRE-family HTH domain